MKKLEGKLGQNKKSGSKEIIAPTIETCINDINSNDMLHGDDENDFDDGADRNLSINRNIDSTDGNHTRNDANIEIAEVVSQALDKDELIENYMSGVIPIISTSSAVHWSNSTSSGETPSNSIILFFKPEEAIILYVLVICLFDTFTYSKRAF